MGGNGYGGMGNGMDGECCPSKKIWGSMNPKMDGMYVNVGQMSWDNLPRRCNSPCAYKRKGANDGMKYCFGDSQYSQSQCDAGMDDGEEPVDMGPGSGSEDGEFPVDMGSGPCMGSGSMGSGCMEPGSGSGGEDPIDMGSGSEDPVNMGSGSGSGSGSEDP